MHSATALTDVPTPNDETLRGGGALHPGWARVLGRFDTWPPAEIESRQAEINRRLRANGIAYSAATAVEMERRPWRLDLIPQVIEADDWARLVGGLDQRARLMQALFADLYGERRVLREAIVPATAVLGHAGFRRGLRPMPGVQELPLYGADVSRSPSGEWYVVDDIFQSPSGVGYALENRVVLAQVLPRLYRECQVCRVVGYFRALQQRLMSRVDRDSRCVLLTYDATSPHYFEHAYLAKYLGYTLVELNDLTVREERVWVKTVDGLQRVDVILRMVLDEHLDPLATSNGSGLGVPGLLRAAQNGTVRVINPLGVAALENPALDAYIKPLCRFLLDEPLQLLSAPTYWLGDEKQCAHVLSRFDELLYRDINTHSELLDPAVMSSHARAALQARCQLDPARLVAQERIDRSAAPVLVLDPPVPHQITLRTFLVREEDGHYQPMNGGLCLLDRLRGGRRAPIEDFDGSKDTWVLSDAPVPTDTLLDRPGDEAYYAMVDGELPSRVAENLFWLGRYTERTEQAVRVLRAVSRELDEEESEFDDAHPLSGPIVALLRCTTAVTGTQPGFIGAGATRRLRHPNRELHALLFNEERAGSLVANLRLVLRSAGTIRDRISADLLRVLNELDDQRKLLATLGSGIERTAQTDLFDRIDERLDALLISLAAFAGLAHENLTHGDGWRFLMLGRRVERARLSCEAIAAIMLHDRNDMRSLENLLRLFDSLMTYRSRYRSTISSRLIMELLLLDETNPRSLAFQFLSIDEEIRQLPTPDDALANRTLLRLCTVGISRMRLADSAALLGATKHQRQSLKKFLEVIAHIPGELSTALSATYFSHTELPRPVTAAAVVGHHARAEDDPATESLDP